MKNNNSENQSNKKPKYEGWFDVDRDDLRKLFELEKKGGGLTKWLLAFTGILLTPITLLGSLLGFTRAYMRFLYPKEYSPEFEPLWPVTRVAMILGSILIWVFLVLVIFLIALFVPKHWMRDGVFLYYTGINLVLTLLIFWFFRRWKNNIYRTLMEGRKFGTARYAREDELEDCRMPPGIYIGMDLLFRDSGHLLTCAGTRSGKFTNLIAPNLLGLGRFEGSWVVIDPKGEACAVTARFQKEIAGRKVVVLNPWGLLADRLPDAATYNPLDILSDANNPHMVDDAQVIAEMIVPIDNEDRDKFFSDNARTIVAGLLIHMSTIAKTPEDCSLQRLWEWIRLPKDEFRTLMEDMIVNDHELFGNVVKQSANEIEMLMRAGDRTWGSIIAVVLQCTDFIKSPALQASMKPGYSAAELSDGNTALYVIIPADKLRSHSRWLRLVTTTLLRAVVRKPNKRVCFILDEFASLGYLPEVAEVALSTYAGFNITVWPIVQSLIQLKGIYGDAWENFIGNTAVRQFFGIHDNFTAEYVSNAIGHTSNLRAKTSAFAVTDAKSNQRALITPDELRRGSGENIFAFIGSKPVTYFPKWPYYDMPFVEDGKKVYDENPYYKS